MVIYSAKTKKVPLNLKEWNELNNYKCIARYNSLYDIFDKNGDYDWKESSNLISDIHYTYNILVLFNNELTHGNKKEVFDKLKENLDNHSDIKDSSDFMCRDYYEKMLYWYNLYTSKPTEETYKTICKEIQQVLKHLTKLGIVKESSCNLKSNYYEED